METKFLLRERGKHRNIETDVPFNLHHHEQSLCRQHFLFFVEKKLKKNKNKNRKPNSTIKECMIPEF